MTSYQYLGNEDERIPQHIQELVVHPTVLEIPAELCFFRFRRLTQVDLSSCRLQKIGRLAFGWCNLIQSIEIPSSVEIIEEGAFESCISLETVVFEDDPSCLVSIGERAFNCCESLVDIEIPSSVEVIRESAFRRCTSMIQVSLDSEGGSLRVIASGAFQECSALEQVDLPRTLETLGSEAFRDCTSLWKVSIAERLDEVDSRAFYGCCSLSVVNMASKRIIAPEMTIRDENDMALEQSLMYTGLKILGEYAFCGCEALTSIALPPSMTEVQRGAFQDCSNLISVELAENNDSICIEYFAFYCCESLVNIAVPETTTEGFNSCTLLCNQYGAANVPQALVHRFDGYSIHKLCYYASETTSEDLMQAIRWYHPQWMTGRDYNNSKDSLVDPFAMTPFHILLSSANGRHRMDLLRILLIAIPPCVLGWKDTFGTLAIEYCWDYQWNEHTRRLIRMILRHWMVGSIEQWGGLDLWKQRMSSHIEQFLVEDDEEESNRLFHEARLKLAMYELWENTSLLELSVWKMAIRTLGCRDVMQRGKGQSDRETCRIQCGASVVLPNVTQFLRTDTFQQENQ